MNVAILGASGFVGRNLMLNIPKEWDVYAFYNKQTDFPKWIKEEDIKATPIQKDLSSNFKISNRYPCHFDLVISLIGNTSHIPEELQPNYDLNADGLSIAGFFGKFSCDKLIYFSTTCIYENHTGLVSAKNTQDIKPSSPYAISKYMSERLIHYFRDMNKIKKFLIVRLSGAYGPYQRPNRIISRLIKKFYFDKNPQVSLIGTGKNIMDAMHVQDTVDFILLAEKQDFKEETIDFHTLCFLTIEKLVEKIARLCFIEKLKIYWDGKPPKENYSFTLTDDSLKSKVPFDYKFKIEWSMGISKFRMWLVKHPEYLPK